MTAITIIAAAMALALLALDALQTLVIVRNPLLHSEGNPAIRWLYERTGERGIIAWFAGCAVAMLIAAAFLYPAGVAPHLCIVVIATQAHFVRHNYRRGIRIGIGKA